MNEKIKYFFITITLIIVKIGVIALAFYLIGKIIELLGYLIRLLLN